MSAWSPYAAASEHNTAIHRHESAAALDALYPLVCVPARGDMLAVLKHDTLTRRKRRRRLAQHLAVHTRALTDRGLLA